MKRIISTAIYLIVILATAVAAYPEEPIQLFFNVPASIGAGEAVLFEVWALNEIGEIDISFYDSRSIRAKFADGTKIQSRGVVLKSDVCRFKNGRCRLWVTFNNPVEDTMKIKIQGFPGEYTFPVSAAFSDGRKVEKKNKLDSFPPEIVEVVVESTNILQLVFNEEVDEDVGTNENRYLAVTDKQEVRPKRVEFHRTYVYLTFEQDFVEGEEGYVEIEDLSDLAGNRATVRSPEFEGICPCME